MAEQQIDFGFVAPAAVAGPTVDPLEEIARGVDSVPTLDEHALGTLEEEFRVLAALRERSDDLARQAEEARKAYGAQRDRMLAAMEAQGTRQFRGADGTACTIAEQYTTSVEDEATFLEWVKVAHPELLSVHSATRTKFVREEYRDKGVPETDPTFPPGLKPGTLRTLMVRGIRKSKES